MRKFVLSCVAMLTVVAVATADEFTGLVTKFEDGKITFTNFDIMALLQGGKAEETTLPLDNNVKILKGKLNLQGGFQGTLQIDADGDYEGGKEAFAKAVKDDAAKKKADDKKAADKKGTDKAGKKGGKGIGGIGGGIGGMFGGGVMAQIITEGEGDKAKVKEIRVVDLAAGLKGIGKKKGGD